MRRCLLIAVLSALSIPAAAAPASDGPAIDGSSSAGPSGVQRSRALDAALGRPVQSGPSNGFGDAPPPQGSFDPGYTDQQNQRAADRTYGSTAPVSGSGDLIAGDVTMTEAGLGDRNEVGETPDYHVVQSGDTLWDISSYYLYDPYLWPKLWSWNDHVTNAHWIFPGDRIRLFDPFGPRYDKNNDGPSLRFSKTKIPLGGRRGPYLLSQMAFVDAERFDSAMTIIGGGEAKVMMATLDTAYLEYDRGNPPIPGERLVVYSPQEKVYDAEGKTLLGYLVMVASDIEVESIAREAVEGTIWNAVNPVERGFKAGPLTRRFKRIDPVPAETTVAGYIVATMNTTAPIDYKDKRRRRGSKKKKVQKGYGDDVLAGEEQFVVVDLGKGTGIEVGNILEVVRKGDEYTKKRIYNIPYEDGWPRRVIGALLVVQVDDKTSLAVTIYSRREFERGDHVELRGPAMENAGTQNQTIPGLEADADAKLDKSDDGVKATGGFKLGN